MKKNQVNDIFNEDARRNRRISLQIILIALLFACCFIFLILYIDNNKVQYVKYNENSDVEYNVNLKDNTFYNNKSIGKNYQYISELINYIQANFKYNLETEINDFQYKYSYRIEANVEVKDKNTKRNIYEYKETLIPAKEFTTDKTKLTINEFVTINYNKYNDLILDFVNTYKLDQFDSMLKVNLIVDVLGSCEDFEQIEKNESITSLEIPLTNKTIAIDITDNLIDNNDKIMICNNTNNYNFVFMLLTIVSALLDFLFIFRLIIFIRNTRSAKTLYEIELKKILNNYRSYIQKVNSRFNLTGYQSLRVDNFTDMLEIRDTTNQPILLVENGSKSGAFFIIPTSTKILYIYSIKVSDYENKQKTE